MYIHMYLRTFHSIIHWIIKPTGLQLTMTPETLSMTGYRKQICIKHYITNTKLFMY